MDYLTLTAHPDTPPLAVTSIQAAFWRDGERWNFRYLLDGTRQLILPDPAEPTRADQLWQTTCFEAFVNTGGQAYLEYNFSPSGKWAAYAFDRPRRGMRNGDEDVGVWLEGGEDWIAVEAAVSSRPRPGSPLGLTAVIEEEGGHKSYWALAHPAKEHSAPPDFHDPSCFIACLPE